MEREKKQETRGQRRFLMAAWVRSGGKATRGWGRGADSHQLCCSTRAHSPSLAHLAVLLPELLAAPQVSGGHCLLVLSATPVTLFGNGEQCFPCPARTGHLHKDNLPASPSSVQPLLLAQSRAAGIVLDLLTSLRSHSSQSPSLGFFSSPSLSNPPLFPSP